jgi:hypothetical protein
MGRVLTADLLKSLTASALLLGVVVLIVTGRLVPRWVLISVRKDRDDRLAELRDERDQWREAARLSETARETLAAAVRESLEANRAQAAVMGAIRTVAERKGDSS